MTDEQQWVLIVDIDWMASSGTLRERVESREQWREVYGPYSTLRLARNAGRRYERDAAEGLRFTWEAEAIRAPV